MSRVRSATAQQSIVGISVRDGAAALQRVQAGLVRTVAGLKAFFGAMSVSLSSESVAGFQNSSSAALVTTGPATATPSGGSAPYTYLWEQVGGSDWTINSPTAATTTFGISVDAGDNKSTTFTCTVTDGTGFEATSAEISASAVNLGGGTL